MSHSLIGVAGVPGGVWPRAAAVHGDWLVEIVTRGDESSMAVGIHLPDGAAVGEPAWTRSLAVGPCHATQTMSWLPQPSAVSGPAGVYVCSGTDRLLLDPTTGDTVAQHEADAAPSAPAVLSGELLVPEGESLATYDATSLEQLGRRPTPDRLWCGPIADGWATLRTLAIYAADPRIGALWRLDDDTVMEVANGYPISAAPAIGQDVIVVSCGGAAGRRLVAMHPGGAELWAVAVDEHAGIGHNVDPAVAIIDSAVVATTQRPALEVRDAATGEGRWMLELDPLSSAPTAFALDGHMAWIGTDDRHLIAVDVASCRKLAEDELANESGWATCIIPVSAASGHAAVVVATNGAVYRAHVAGR